MAMVLTACPPNCEYRLIDYGLLSEEALAWSPYVDGQSYSFIHSGGKKITFFCDRSREIRTAHWDDCTEVNYEVDLGTLTPDYPIFNCSVLIQKTDTTAYSCLISAGGSSFWLPSTIETDFGNSYFDSLQFGQLWYREVYKIGNSRWDGNPPGQILADSIYYNTSHGILKILMSNGEYYEISD